ncbi:baseplate hub protein, partial [Escherichia coli]|uniref:baseplate hub domain-containing protein n=1 Tax=Escherichia coli TaxID=562 RepID=UPI003B9E406E
MRLIAVDWSNPGAEPVFLARGELGEVSVSDGAFTAELRGPTALLERSVVEATSPECRAELGDRRCRVDLAGRTRF